jgi:hypothetical protein
VSADCDKSSVICTLGKKIVYVMEVRIELKYFEELYKLNSLPVIHAEAIDIMELIRRLQFQSYL